MPSFRDFLLRFRPTGAPGRPAAAGVPVDRSAELRTELMPVLELLEAPGREADAIRAEAARQAEDIRQAGRAEAGRILAAAAPRAREAREQAEAELLDHAEQQADALLAAAERATQATLRRGRSRLPALAESVAAQALALATGGPRPEPPSGARSS